MSKKHVIVVGAGCAGLSATYTLQKAGIEVTCLEAADIAGGRCRTVKEDGYQFTIAAGSTEPQWATTFTYLEELGLLDRVYSLKKQRYSYKRNGKIRTVTTGGSFFEMIKASAENIRFLLFAMPVGTLYQALKVFIAMRKYMKLVNTENHDFSKLREISNTSLEDFVLKHGGPKALEWIFHPFTATMILARPKDVSVAHPISLFSLMKGMCSLEGGLGLLTATLYEKVKDSVRLSTPVKRIVIEKGRAVGVDTAEGFIASDHVICAVDAVLAQRLIPDLPEAMQKPLATCKYSSSYYYQFGLEKFFQDVDAEFNVQMIPASEDTILGWTAWGCRKDEKPVMIVACRGWEDEKLSAMNDDDRRRLVISEVQKIFPEFPDEPVKTMLFRWESAVNIE
jgi:oxygen-dependent protoporphyrinogen oxidase